MPRTGWAGLVETGDLYGYGLYGCAIAHMDMNVEMDCMDYIILYGLYGCMMMYDDV